MDVLGPPSLHVRDRLFVVVPHPLVPVGAAALQYHYREAFNGVGSEAEDKCSAVNE